jgi:hypothetical protein
MLGLQLVVLFWEVMKTLGSETYLKEVGSGLCLFASCLS